MVAPPVEASAEFEVEVESIVTSVFLAEPEPEPAVVSLVGHEPVDASEDSPADAFTDTIMDYDPPPRRQLSVHPPPPPPDLPSQGILHI